MRHPYRWPALVTLALCILAIRRWHLRWGTVEAERQKPLPGDEIVPEPTVLATRALTIAAPAAGVWSQLAAGNGAMRTLQPGAQLLVGNTLYTIERADTPNSLVMAIRHPHNTITCAVVLTPLDGATTRLLIRTRLSAGASLSGVLFTLAMDAPDFVKLRRQMLDIKDRAEQCYLAESKGVGGAAFAAERTGRPGSLQPVRRGILWE